MNQDESKTPMVWQTFVLVAAALSLFLAGSYWGPGRLRDDVRAVERNIRLIEAWEIAHMRLPPHGGSIPTIVEAEFTALRNRIAALEDELGR